MTYNQPEHHAEQLAKARAAFKQNPTPALSSVIRRLERALKWKPPKIPNGVSQWGAQTGRSNTIGNTDFPIKFHLFRLHLDSGGYERGSGAYWGVGNPMWRAIGEDEDMVNEMFIRAASRHSAKEQVLEVFPNAKFYR